MCTHLYVGSAAGIYGKVEAGLVAVLGGPGTLSWTHVYGSWRTRAVRAFIAPPATAPDPPEMGLENQAPVDAAFPTSPPDAGKMKPPITGSANARF